MVAWFGLWGFARLMATLALLCGRVALEESSATPSIPPTHKPAVHHEDNTTNPFLLFRVCGASPTGEIFRFPLEENCPNTEDKEHVEGILLIYKTNIVPYIFNVRKYRKLVTSTTIYKGWSQDAITNQYTSSFAMPLWESRLVDYNYECYNGIQVTENGHLTTYVDRDGYNESVRLVPADGLTSSIRRYHSQPELYVTPRNLLWSYTTRTTVNCEVIDMTARSQKPFEYFVTASGDSIETSPFYTNASRRVPVQVLNNYSVTDYGVGLGSGKNVTRFFATLNDFSISWKAATENSSYCPLVLWKGFPSAIQTKHEKSYHFIADAVTASFTNPLTDETSYFNTTYQCAWQDIEGEIQKRFDPVSKTHARNGSVQIYKTSGNLYVVWQPLVQLDLLAAHAKTINSTDNSTSPTTAPNTTTSTSSRRKRRDTGNTATNNSSSNNSSMEENLATSQVQFAYDQLRKSINRVLEQLSRVWCQNQYRASLMWYELSKINPTSVMSAIYGRPVSAKLVGDVVQISDCITVDQESVFVHRNLRVPGSKDLCYTRPVVGFKFVNGSELFVGQLGARNEILLSTNLVEVCQHSCEHYFQGGNHIYKYKNYEYVSTMNLTDVPTLHTMITLNLSLVENVDFQVIQLYSQKEKKLSNVFDIETMFREYNYYTQNLKGLRKDLDDSIHDGRDSFIQFLGDLVQDLGPVGDVIVNVASGVFSLFGSIVSGVISFLKNPFGGILAIALIVGGIIVLYLFITRSRTVYQAPIRMLYPEVDRAPQQNVQPIPEDQVRSILLAMHQFQQQQQQQQQQEEHTQRRSIFDTIRESTSNILRRRRGGGGYTRLRQRDSDGEGDYEDIQLRGPPPDYDDVGPSQDVAETGV
uniref:Glycoprotein B n=1 Tax=Equid gammaherpesvirus 5 TaxID=10371 RepID=D1KRT4_9GAMA|nr:glycoprotein B [Equid gammaherpesvirus 5]